MCLKTIACTCFIPLHSLGIHAKTCQSCHSYTWRLMRNGWSICFAWLHRVKENGQFTQRTGLSSSENVGQMVLWAKLLFAMFRIIITSSSQIRRKQNLDIFRDSDWEKFIIQVSFLTQLAKHLTKCCLKLVCWGLMPLWKILILLNETSKTEWGKEATRSRNQQSRLSKRKLTRESNTEETDSFKQTSDKTLTKPAHFFVKHNVSAAFHSLHQVKNIREPGEHNLI